MDSWAQGLSAEQLRTVRKLAFAEPLEREYRDAQFKTNLPALRMTGFVGIAAALANGLLVAFGLYDRSLRGNVLQFAFWMALALLVPLVVSYTKAARRWLSVTFAAFFPAFLVILGLTLRGLPALDQVRNGIGITLLVTACLYMLARLPFRLACLSGIGMLLVFSFLVLPVMETDFRTLIIGLLLVAVMHLFGIVSLIQGEQVSRKAFLLQKLLAAEQAKTEELLLNVLPRSIAERLKASAEIIADSHDDASVLFADIVDFTPFSAGRPAAEVVRHLNDMFSRFDEMVAKHGLEKIKTIGDAYMVAGGIPTPTDDHLAKMAALALDIRSVANELGAEVRIGLHSGPLVAGVIGSKKLLYDLWGDTVNTASRMESHGEPGMIQVTAHAAQRLSADFTFSSRGVVELKGIGHVETFELVARRDSASATNEAGPDSGG